MASAFLVTPLGGYDCLLLELTIVINGRQYAVYIDFIYSEWLSNCLRCCHICLEALTGFMRALYIYDIIGGKLVANTIRNTLPDGNRN